MALADLVVASTIIGYQFNALDVDGTPLGTADGDDKVLVLNGGGDAGQLDVTEQIDAATRSPIGNCYSVITDRRKTGDEMTWTNCPRNFYALRVLAGAANAALNTAGALVGTLPFAPGETQCDDCNVSSTGFAGMCGLVWLCSTTCDSQTFAVNDASARTYEIIPIPRMSAWTPAGGLSYGAANLANQRSSYTFEVSDNAAFWAWCDTNNVFEETYSGPGGAPIKSTLAFPGDPLLLEDCCDQSIGGGEYVTAAGIAATTHPTPVGG